MAITKMRKPYQGQRFGCTDTAAPTEYTPAQLSRLADMMYAAQEAGLDHNAVFAVAPRNMRVEWIYSKWSYELAC